MPRYIIIDRHSGYIWGDTADYAANRQSGLDPIEACRLLDQSNGEHDREYREVNRPDAEAKYDVFRADVGGSEAVTVVTDGQDPETIEAVQRDCEFVTSVSYRDRSITSVG